MIKKFTIIFLCQGLLFCCGCLEQSYSGDPGFSFELFKNTPVEKLAKAVQQEDTAKIRSLIKSNNAIINYQDPKFGSTLLTVAIHDQKFISMQQLLLLGANPNTRSKIYGNTPFTDFCDYSTNSTNAQDVLKLLIQYGGDINTNRTWNEKKPDGTIQKFHRTVLQALCQFGNIDLVRLLVYSGARLDIYPTNGENSLIYYAATNSKLDILRYLLIEKRVPVPDYVFINIYASEPTKITLRQFLKNDHDVRQPDVEQQNIEDEILSFLSSNGK